MATKEHIELHQRAVSEGILHVRHRAASLAKQASDSGASDDVVKDIICSNLDYMARSVGRRAQGVQKSTGRVRDHKARKSARVRHMLNAFAHNVDLSRVYAHRSAPYRPSGVVWSSVSRSKKRKFRAMLNKTDQHFNAGEITVALEMLKLL